MRDEIGAAWRGIVRSWRFSAACGAVLALGIGLSTAVFAAARAVLVQPLPVADESRVVAAWATNPARALAHLPLTVREWRDFSARSRALRSTAAVDYNPAWPWVLRDGDAAYPAVRGLVSGGFFSVLGISPSLGRLLRPDDDRLGAEPVAVLSHAFWQRQFGGDSSVLGRRLTMHASGRTFTVVGVAPPGLDYPAGTEVYMPLVLSTTYPPADTSTALVDVVGRLNGSATPSDVAAELSAFLQSPERPATTRQGRAVVTPFRTVVTGSVSRELAIAAAAVGILLLVACTNVAALLLMRGAERSRDVALRLAVGASPARIVRRQALEGGMLALLGGGGGIAVAVATLGALRRLAPPGLPRLDEIRTDGWVLAIALVVALLSAVLFAVGPAFAAARQDAADLLRGGSASIASARGRFAARSLLAAAQVALAVLTLTAATLVMRSLQELQRAELGFDPRRVMVAELGWDFTQVDTPERSLAVYDALLPRVEALPGAMAATATLLTPFAGTGGLDVIYVAGDRPADEQRNNPWLNTEVVSPSYREVFRVQLLEGRWLTEGDREGSAGAVVLSARAARALWPDGTALGRELRLLPNGSPTDAQRWTVVGIVADTRYRDYRDPRPTVYFPHRQPPFPMAVTMLAVRASGDPMALVPQVRTLLREVSPAVVLGKAASMERHLERPLAQPRFLSAVIATFAASALLLVAVGLYATLSFSVRLRARELAVRSAIGATPRTLRRLVVRSAAAIVGGGMVAGFAVAAALTRLLRSVLYGVAPGDPWALAAAGLAAFVVAALATLVPARSAGRAAPAELLRSD